MGLQVEIAPTIDFKEENVLIRWTDIAEGFNDRVIVKNLDEFTSLFSLINK